MRLQQSPVSVDGPFSSPGWIAGPELCQGWGHGPSLSSVSLKTPALELWGPKSHGETHWDGVGAALPGISVLV